MADDGSSEHVIAPAHADEMSERCADAQTQLTLVKEEPKKRKGPAESKIWLVRKWNAFVSYSFHPDDDYEHRIRKRTIISSAFPICLFLLLSLISDTFALLGHAMSAEVPPMGKIKTMPLWGVMYILIHVFMTKKLPRSHIQAFVWIIGIMIVLSDWAGHNEGETSRYYGIWTPTWPVAFLVMDASLVSKLGTLSECALLIMFLIWLIMRSLEECYRFGMWDVPLEVNRTDMWVLCPDEGGACAKECNGLTFVHVMLRTTLVLTVDFVVTRGFREQANAAIALAEDVSAAMVRFDLVEAQDQLDVASGAPWRLREGFRNLIENLHRYRPFLPDVLFDGVRDEEEEEEAEEDAHVDDQSSASSHGAAARRSTAGISKGSAASSRMSKARGSSVGSRRSTAVSMSVKDSVKERAEANAKKNDRILQAMAMGVTKKSIVIVSCTLRPWEWTSQGNSPDVDAACAAWLETTYSAGKGAKATILGVRGQQATLVWGNMQKVAVTAACIKAAGCVTSIIQALTSRPLPHNLKPHCGIAAGPAQVGNQGSAEFREHCILGSLCGTARAMSLFAEFMGARACMDKITAGNVENEFDCRQVDRFHWIAEATESEHDPLPGNYRPFDIYELQDKKEEKANDEWMYQLEEEEAKKKGQVSFFDDGLSALFAKEPDYRTAASALTSHTEKEPGDIVAVRLRDAAAACAANKAAGTYARRAWRNERWQTFVVHQQEPSGDSVRRVSVRDNLG
eukprot:TRINITY_DN6539_c0_g1_i2.p1 TRINITY_DN6539_c0_g1~~TRINITY_DN6539_c0_g1_i2.p1  ORF type:complete len:776 (+),score=319.56 TRINITY_DN6539_c0_g1_i2:113-2329(+)